LVVHWLDPLNRIGADQGQTYLRQGLIGISFAYKSALGWERGKVVGIEKNKNSEDYGMFIVTFITERNKRCLALESEDYDVDDILNLRWVCAERCSDAHRMPHRQDLTKSHCATARSLAQCVQKRYTVSATSP